MTKEFKTNQISDVTEVSSAPRIVSGRLLHRVRAAFRNDLVP